MPERKKVACEMCGTRFADRRDHRRWRASALPTVGGAMRGVQEAAGAKPKQFIVCTVCFLKLAEAEYAV